MVVIVVLADCYFFQHRYVVQCLHRTFPRQTGVNLVVLLFFTQFLRNVTFNMQQSIGIHTGAVIKPKTMEMTTAMPVISTSR